MKHLCTMGFWLVMTTMAFGQQPLNQVDAQGKRQGKWKVYWDAGWKKTDSSHAVYTGYTFYADGQDLYPMGPRNKKWKVEITGRNENDALLLDGEYKWYDEKGRLRSVDVFKQGVYMSYKWYTVKGWQEQLFDYTRLYKGQAHTWYMAEYDKNGKPKYEGYFRDNGRGRWLIVTEINGAGK